MDAGCRIRAATSADLAAVAGLEAVCFADAWSADAFRAHLDDTFLVADGPDGIRGYLVARVVGSEAEILNVAVAPAARRRGVGRALLDAALAALARAGVRRVYLEVRVSNVRGRGLYEQSGFVEVGRRRGYYQRPREDALILARDLIPATAGA